MGQLAAIITKESEKFLEIHQATLIVKHLFRESYRTTWIYLSQNHVFDDLEVYEKGKNLSFNIIDKGNTFVEADDYALSGRVDTTGFFSGSIHKKYWKKSDFLELESIRKIGITYEIIEHYLSYFYVKAGHDSFTPFKDIPPPNLDKLILNTPVRVVPLISKAPRPITPLNGSSYTPNQKKDKTIQSNNFGHPTIQQSEPNIENLNAEIARLRKEIVDKDKTTIELQNRIEELEALQSNTQPIEQIKIQTSQPESKLSTREENNIIKVLAVLANIDAKIDISKPYEAHGIMQRKAQLLGIDSFPSNESIKKWFTKANECKKS